MIIIRQIITMKQLKIIIIMDNNTIIEKINIDLKSIIMFMAEEIKEKNLNVC